MSQTELSRYEQSLLELTSSSDALVVLTAENRVHIKNLPDVLGPRFIDVGICEQTLVGAAAGLALRGRRPFVHALAAFLTMRAFEFVRTDIGLANLPVTLVGFVPGILSEANGPTHQAIEDIALMRLVPNMQIVCPANVDELVDCIPAIYRSRRPCYLRFNDRQPAYASHQPFVLGEAEVRGSGNDVALLTYGAMVAEAEKARVILEKQGIGLRLVNLRSLVPLDEDTVLETVCATRLTVVLQDHVCESGLYDIVLGLLSRFQLDVDILPLGFARRGFIPTAMDLALDHEGLSGEKIAIVIKQEFMRSRRSFGSLDNHRQTRINNA
jgi:transketolase